MPSLQKMFLALLCLTDVLNFTPPCAVHGFENVRYRMVERNPEVESPDDRVVTTFKLNVKGMTTIDDVAFLGDIVAEPGSDTTGHSLLISCTVEILYKCKKHFIKC